MTDEIIKLYENAGIEPIAEYCKHQCNNEFDDDACIGCKHIEKVEYPPFTAEKQLKLIKWLAINKEDFGIHYSDYDEEYCWVCGCKFEVEVYRIFNEDKTFEESLAGLINRLWQNKIFSLTEEEKQQIKEILE